MNYDQIPLINVDELTIFDYAGHKRISLGGGDLYINFFADKLIAEWIPYFECHQCGRGDYCKFTIPHGVNPHRKKDIKCGVVETLIRNFIKYTCKVFETLSKNDKQKYLDGLYYLQRYVYQAEQNIGMFLDEGILNYFDKFVPRVFGNTPSLRSDLNSFAEHFKDIKEFNIQKGILLVEGWSEKVFIQRMFEGGSIWSNSFDIEVYDGKNNKSPKKLQLLINKLRKDGYEIYIQGDQDGNQIDAFQEHKKRELLKDSHIFQFSHDFETAFPAKLMFHSLKELEILEIDDLEEFENLIYPCEESISNKLKRVLGIDINGNKVPIADMAGKIITRLDWWNKNEIMETELGMFLNFVRKI
jgi:hypothetical protein